LIRVFIKWAGAEASQASPVCSKKRVPKIARCAAFLVVLGGSARAAGGVDAPVERVLIEGSGRRTRDETILELLPRRPPTAYSAAELTEFERRVNNLAIFDEVGVIVRARVLHVSLREKWTLIPSIEFASGETLADSHALVGVTEFNFLGSANQLSLAVSMEQRGWGAMVAYNEHSYRRHRWSLGVDLSYSTSQARFEDGSSWRLASVSGSVGFTSPPWLSDHLVYRVGAWSALDTVSDVVGPAQPDGFTAGTQMSFIWDDYEWHDLVPQGWSAAATLGTGFLATQTLKPHDTAELVIVLAAPLTSGTALLGRSVSSAVTRGDPNAANLLGSIEGVRGLRDGYYRTWLQSYANLELRQALPIASRWALQGVLFGDAAAFEQVTASGARGASGTALSLGAGTRLIPTWLAGLLLRVDAARLLAPESAWFVQVGLGQYF
jgi:hypothetical protein